MAPRFCCCNLITTGFVVGAVGVILSIISYLTYASSLETVRQLVLQNTKDINQEQRDALDESKELELVRRLSQDN